MNSISRLSPHGRDKRVGAVLAQVAKHKRRVNETGKTAVPVVTGEAGI